MILNLRRQVELQQKAIDSQQTMMETLIGRVEKLEAGKPSEDQMLELVARKTLEDDFLNVDRAAIFENSEGPSGLVARILFRDLDKDSLDLELDFIDLDNVIGVMVSTTAWDKLMSGEIPVPKGWGKKPVHVIERNKVEHASQV